MKLGGVALMVGLGALLGWSCGGDDDKASPTEDTLELCTDDVDNDTDQFVDCDDQHCQIFAVCVSAGSGQGGSAGEPEVTGPSGAAGRAGETSQGGTSLQSGGSGDAGATEGGGALNVGGRGGSGGSIQGGGGSSVGGSDPLGGSAADGGSDPEGGTVGLGGAEEPGGTSAVGGAANVGPAVGAFTISLIAASADSTTGRTRVTVTVADVPVPEPIVWDTVSTVNGCSLLSKRVPFCEGCGDDEVCVEEDVCAAEPTRLSVGGVSLTGLGDGTVELEITTGSFYQLGEISLPYPPFDEGDPVLLTAEGDELAGFSVESKGIDELVLLGEDPIPVSSGEPFTLDWRPARLPGNSRILVDVAISHHGAQRARVYCEVADSGSLEIAAEQITDLLAMGRSGWPAVVVTRIASGSTMTAAGPVKLDVISTISRALDIPGIVSCASDDDCPPEQTCQDDLTCAP